MVKLNGADVRPPPLGQAGLTPVESVTGTVPIVATSAAVIVAAALVPAPLTTAPRDVPLKLTVDTLVQKFVPVRVKVNEPAAPAVRAGGFSAVIAGFCAIAGMEAPAAHANTVIKNREVNRFTFGLPPTVPDQ
jgi:hypothetical protein